MIAFFQIIAKVGLPVNKFVGGPWPSTWVNFDLSKKNLVHQYYGIYLMLSHEVRFYVNFIYFLSFVIFVICT